MLVWLLYVLPLLTLVLVMINQLRVLNLLICCGIVATYWIG